MSKLTLSDIKLNATNYTTYSFGEDLYYNERVKLVDTIITNFNTKYKFKVDGTNVDVVLDNDNNVISSSCKCGNFYNYHGDCSHIVACELYLLNKPNSIVNDNEDFSSILNIYKSSKKLNISLLPVIVFMKDKISVSLKIGKGKMYVVKSIPSLLDRIRNKEEYAYGKELSFVHDINAFDEKSQRLISLINELVDVKENSYGKEVYVSTKFIDRIINIFDGDVLECLVDYEEKNLTVSATRPPVSFIYESDRLAVCSASSFKLLEYQYNSFVVYASTLYSFSNYRNDYVCPLYNKIYKHALKMNNVNLQQFFTYIYPKIKEDVVIINKEQLEALNNISHVETKVYLDMFKDNLYMDFKFMYNGLDKEEASKASILFNEVEEDEFMESIREWGFAERGSKWCIEGRDEAFEFIFNKLDALRSIAEVFVTDSIKNLAIRKLNKNAIGVRFSNNLMEVVFQDSTFTVEELEKILKNIRLNKKYHQLKSGEIIKLDDEYAQELATVFDSVSFKDDMKLPIYKSLQFDKLVDKDNLPDQIKNFLFDLRNYSLVPYDLAPALDSKLKDYQRIGFQWMSTLAKYNLGGVLADDMGLGKSLQTISLFDSDKVELPSIIICPASLIYNWENEFKKFNSSLKVKVIAGNAKERERLISKIDGRRRVYITSYDYLRRDDELYKDKQFRFIAIDEASNIKNHSTLNAKSVKKINAQARFALTGTPIENSLSDLWSIFDFILPGYLKSYARFREDYEVGIVRDDDKKLVEDLSKMISPFILRRTKKEVLHELPKKIEEVIYATMDEDQRGIYDARLLEARRELQEADKFTMFKILTSLRQICCDPVLYSNSYKGKSAKLEVLMNILKQNATVKNKTLVFSQFTSMLDIIQKELDKENIKYLVLTGETPTKVRLDLVNEFNESDDCFVFLISLKAGGMGLNLTSAQTVVHYDPWWNLSVENQATDRAHRIGQLNNVFVIKLIAKGSIEEKILTIQERKQALSNSVISDDEHLATALSDDELISLFE